MRPVALHEPAGAVERALQRRAVECERRQLGRLRASRREVGERATEPRRELEPMGGAERDADLFAAGHTIDDEVAIGGERVEARRRLRRAESVAEQLAS